MECKEDIFLRLLADLKKKGFKLVGLKQLIPSKDLAQNHYGVLKERPYFGDLVDFISLVTDIFPLEFIEKYLSPHLSML